MSRTVRRLPVGKSNYYNRVGRFSPSDIHVLKHPSKPQPQGSFVRQYGLYLFQEHEVWRNRYTVPYEVAEPRPSKYSISGPKWIDASDFHSEKVQSLIEKGWTFSKDYGRRQWGPEEWDYYLVTLGPAFSWQWLWYSNPDFDEELHDQYRQWHSVHEIIHRNGHYKSRRSTPKSRRNDKQRDHQVTRARLKDDLAKELRAYWNEE